MFLKRNLMAGMLFFINYTFTYPLKISLSRYICVVDFIILQNKQIIMNRFLYSLLFLSLAVSALAQEHILSGREAQAKVPNAHLVRYEDYTKIPTFIRFRENNPMEKGYFSSFVVYQLGLSPHTSWGFLNGHDDEMGYLHERYRQIYKGVEIEGSMLMVHSKGGKISALSGDVFSEIDVEVSPSLSAVAALPKALAYIGAEEYIWEVWRDKILPNELANLKEAPKGKLVLVPMKGNYKGNDWHLAWKFDVYALNPMSRQDVYIDAQTGDVIHVCERIHHADVVGTADTRYSGIQNIVTDSFSGGYRLREAGRSGIETYDMNQGTDYSLAEDFVDADNYWDNTANMDKAAPDAHWAAEMFYDYYSSVHNRNSINGNGMKIISYVHYDVGYFNAFWNGQFATLGDGTGLPLTTLDVVAHEFTHGVTQFSAGLIYQNESGALNESFSDIFGKSIEKFARPNGFSWIMGLEFGPNNSIRSMSNPNSHGDPDTYFGTSWKTGSADNGGVHSNSGVQNKWYYLLVEGETGTNDLGNAYNVTGIGFIDAAKIAYRNLNTYLTPSSEYLDARFYSLQAAVDIFGACSPQVQSTGDAWYAVGIGTPYQAVVTTDFEYSNPIFCEPDTVYFYNYSSNSAASHWNFGDGSTSTANTPVVAHYYSNYGIYDVQLITSGGSCGSDTLTMTNLVSIDSANPCYYTFPASTAIYDDHCAGTLYDDGGPDFDYSSFANGTFYIAPTNAYQINLDFSMFKVAYDDTLYIYDGNTTSAPVLGAYSANTPPPSTLQSSGGALTLRFRSTDLYKDSGFVAHWTCMQPTHKPIVYFSADTTYTCDGIIQFQDLSQQAVAWNWDFGDGASSTLKHPQHTYLANGTYTVSLTAINSFGAETYTKIAYITINRPAKPVVQDVYICGTGSATLTAAGSGGILEWFHNGNLIHTGNTVTTPILSAPYSYNLKETIWNVPSIGGKANNSGTGNYYAYDNRAMLFDVLAPCVLRDVDMYAQSAGNRTIQVLNQYGAVLMQKNVMLQTGLNTVSLDFELPIMTQAHLKVSGTSDLFRNTQGGAYPYNVGNLLTITNNDALNTNQYYFFYNWKVTERPCISEEKTVTVYAGGSAPTANFTYTQNLSTFVFDGTSSTNTLMYNWDFGDGTSGTGANPTHTYNAVGSYNVQFMAQNGGCTNILTQTVNVSALTDIESQLGITGIALFPNPNEGAFHLVYQLSAPQPTSISVFNALGQIVWSEKMPAVAQVEKEIHLSTISKGIYYLQIASENGVVSRKIEVR